MEPKHQDILSNLKRDFQFSQNCSVLRVPVINYNQETMPGLNFLCPFSCSSWGTRGVSSTSLVLNLVRLLPKLYHTWVLKVKEPRKFLQPCICCMFWLPALLIYLLVSALLFSIWAAKAAFIWITESLVLAGVTAQGAPHHALCLLSWCSHKFGQLFVFLSVCFCFCCWLFVAH